MSSQRILTTAMIRTRIRSSTRVASMAAMESVTASISTWNLVGRALSTTSTTNGVRVPRGWEEGQRRRRNTKNGSNGNLNGIMIGSRWKSSLSSSDNWGKDYDDYDDDDDDDDKSWGWSYEDGKGGDGSSDSTVLDSLRKDAQQKRTRSTRRQKKNRKYHPRKLSPNQSTTKNQQHPTKKQYKVQSPKVTSEKSSSSLETTTTLSETDNHRRRHKDNDEKERNRQWNKRFQELVAYKQKYGHANVPSRNNQPIRYKALGRWVRNQRSIFRQKLPPLPSDHHSNDDHTRHNGSDDTHDHHHLDSFYRHDPQSLTHLSPALQERYQKLRSVGFVLDVSAASWEGRFSQLTSLHRDHLQHKQQQHQHQHHRNRNSNKNNDNILIDNSYNLHLDLDLLLDLALGDPYSPHRDLARWTERQRDYWARKRAGEDTPLTDERERKLADLLGEEWSGTTSTGMARRRRRRVGEKWARNYANLRRFYELRGRVDIPPLSSATGSGAGAGFGDGGGSVDESDEDCLRDHKDGVDGYGDGEENGVRIDGTGQNFEGLRRWVHRQRYAYHQWKRKQQKRKKQQKKLKQRQLSKSQSDQDDNSSNSDYDSSNNNNVDDRPNQKEATTTEQTGMTQEKYLALCAIHFPWDNAHNVKWEEMLHQLREYRYLHGNCMVPQNYRRNPKLGKWVRSQRIQYEKLQQIQQTSSGELSNTTTTPKGAGATTSLTQQRIELLDAEGFVWQLKRKKRRNRSSNDPQSDNDGDDHHEDEDEDPCRDDVRGYIDDLQRFKDLHGHCCVPATYPKNEPLARWVALIRSEFALRYMRERDGDVVLALQQQQQQQQQLSSSKSRNDPIITQNEIQILNDMGFTWDEEEARWWATYHRFRSNQARGVSRAAQKKLSEWMEEQMRIWEERERAEMLTEDRDGGGSFSPWSGDRLVALRFLKDDLLLEGGMGNKNEKDKDKDSYSAEMVMAGDAVGADHRGEYETVQDRGATDDHHENDSKEDYIDIDGDIENATNQTLHTKESNRNDNGTNISKSQTAATMPQSRKWDEMFEALKLFHTEYGTSHVPQMYPPDPQLGVWVLQQRERYAKKMQRGRGTSVNGEAGSTVNGWKSYGNDDYDYDDDSVISNDEIIALNTLDFAWDIEEIEWEILYRDLLTFKAQHGHCQVPLWFPSNPRLGSWVFAQQKSYQLYMKVEQERQKQDQRHYPKSSKSGSHNMSKLRIKLLEDAGIVWQYHS